MCPHSAPPPPFQTSPSAPSCPTPTSGQADSPPQTPGRQPQLCHPPSPTRPPSGCCTFCRPGGERPQRWMAPAVVLVAPLQGSTTRPDTVALSPAPRPDVRRRLAPWAVVAVRATRQPLTWTRAWWTLSGAWRRCCPAPPLYGAAAPWVALGPAADGAGPRLGLAHPIADDGNENDKNASTLQGMSCFTLMNIVDCSLWS
jgi:hypothetical protein